MFCDDEPIRDDRRLSDYNADERSRQFVAAAREWSAAYASDNVLMPMGSDFNYVSAGSWYKNLDKLIRHVNSGDYNGKGQKPVHLLVGILNFFIISMENILSPPLA